MPEGFPKGFAERAVLQMRAGALRVGARGQPACLWSMPNGYMSPGLIHFELDCAREFALEHPEGWWFVVDIRRVRFINPINPFLLRRILRLPNILGYVSISPRWIRILAWLGRFIFRPTHLVKAEEEALSITREL